MEPSNHVLVVGGGEFKPPTLSLTGEKGLLLFENLYVEKLFLATGGDSVWMLDLLILHSVILRSSAP